VFRRKVSRKQLVEFFATLQPCTILVRDALNAGTLVTVLDEYTTDHSVFQLLWPSGRHITPKLRAFIDFVSEHVRLEKEHQRLSGGRRGREVVAMRP
jgi:hypothetical protein